MITIPTVDDWYALVRRYPQFGNWRDAVLKHYGMLACTGFIEDHFGAVPERARVLEFGHGFAPEVLQRFQDRHEVWGIDQDQGLTYFKDVDWEGMFAKTVLPGSPNVRFVRGLLGDGDSELPNGYFDCIFSISVLEEVPVEVVRSVTAAAARKLRPGGFLVGTHDLNVKQGPGRVRDYILAQQDAGLEIAWEPDRLKVDLRDMLLENVTSVMMYYQMAEPEETRRYWGHYATVFSVARKPL